MPIPLFGAPAMLPMGPAMLAVESGVPTYALTVRRAGSGRYRGRVVPIDVPVDGTRRERVMATMTRLAAAFEELIADAPDQWWAVFFPIWPDLEARRRRGGTADGSRGASRSPPAAASATKPAARSRDGGAGRPRLERSAAA